MATKKFSELTSLDPSADLTKTYIPVFDEVSSTTRKISLQQINDAVELTIPFAQAAFNVANTATTNASTADQKAVAAGLYANSAFLRANNSLNVQSGGTVTGDLTLTGNLSITGCTASLVVSTLRTSDPVIDLSYGVSGSPTQNAGVRVLRGDEPSTQLRWNETSNLWDFTNDGTTYNGIAAAWVESFSANSYIHANAAFAAANAASADQIARNQANSSYIHANASYTASNTANAYTITVNTLLNNTITNVSGYSIKTNSAYDYANATSINVSIVADYTNSAYYLANVANNRAYSAQDNSGVASSYANSGFGVANSASSYANGAFTTANIAIPAASYANGAFGIANSASSYANGAFTTANIAIPAASYANGAFTQANTGVTNAATADQKAVSAGSYANGAFQSANTAETALLLYDTRITIAADYANSAFIQANVADQRAVTSGSYANGAFARANTVSPTNHINITNELYDGGEVSITANTTVYIYGGNSTIPGQSGGWVNITGGDGGPDDGDNSGSGGSIDMSGGVGTNALNDSAGWGGEISVVGGTGGDANVTNLIAAGAGGRVFIKGGTAGDTNGDNSLAVNGPNVEIHGGLGSFDSGTMVGRPGDVIVQGGGDGWIGASGNVKVKTSPDGYSYHTWDFTNTGSLTFPDNTIQTTAYTGGDAAGSYANGAFARANTSLNVASGGTVTGDIITQGNMYVQKLIYTGNTTVEQTTSRGTGVTLNSSFGDVILYNASMTAGQIDAIAVTNNKAKAGDLIVCSVLGSPGTYIAGGYCTTDSIIVLWIKNITDSSTSTMQPIIKFALIQPVTSV